MDSIAVKQPWPRYLKGDKISTKTGIGRVKIWTGWENLPDPDIGSRSRVPPRIFKILSDIGNSPWIFPKSVEESRGKLRRNPDSPRFLISMVGMRKSPRSWPKAGIGELLKSRSISPMVAVLQQLPNSDSCFNFKGCNQFITDPPWSRQASRDFRKMEV